MPGISLSSLIMKRISRLLSSIMSGRLLFLTRTSW